MKKQSRGFIALISSIIISIVLMAVITSASFTAFYTRSNILDSEFKERSNALVESCVGKALLQLATDPTLYDSVGGTITVGADTCTISNATSGVGTKTFIVSGAYSNFYTTLKIAIATSDLSVVSWEETP